MKHLLAALFLFPLLAFGQQGTSVRANAGFWTNGTSVTSWQLGVTPTMNFRMEPAGQGVEFLVNGLTMGGIADLAGSGFGWVFSTNAVMNGGAFIGNGAGLTNLAFPQEQTFVTNTYFNQTSYFSYLVVTNVAIFNGKTTINSLSFPTNAWAGPTNSLNLGTNYQFFVASTDCAINGIGGLLAGVNTWSTLTISNSTAADITVRSTASGLRPQGSSTLAALIIGAGKEGYLTYHGRELKSTNYVTSTQQ